MAPFELLSFAGHFQRPEEDDGQVLLDHIGIPEIVVEIDTGIVDEDVERFDLGGRPLDLESVGYVQRQGRHAFVGVLKCASRSCIDPLRAPSKRLIHECPAYTAVGPGDQDYLVRDVHTVLLFLDRFSFKKVDIQPSLIASDTFSECAP